MKKAFTMLELVFVIVVVAIISAMIAPSFGGNNLREAADQLVSHIRYTQHLAMMDEKFDASDPKWYRKRWQIIFGKSDNSGSTPDTHNQVAYSIFSDTASNSTGQVDKTEIAKNPLDNTKLLSGGYSGTLDTSDEQSTREMNIGEKYGVISYSLSGGCAWSRISFDYLGRPFKGNLASYTWTKPYQVNKLIQTACNITLSDGTKNITIAIEPETGYAHIL